MNNKAKVQIISTICTGLQSAHVAELSSELSATEAKLAVHCSKVKALSPAGEQDMVKLEL